MRCWWNTDFTYANPIEEIQLSEHVRHWDDHVGNRPIEAIFCGFHSKCFWSAKSDCAWFAFSNTRFLKVDGLQHSNDHDNTVDFYVFNKLIMRHELMIICADSCLHEVMARYTRWIATCFKIKVNLRMDHFLKPSSFQKICATYNTVLSGFQTNIAG